MLKVKLKVQNSILVTADVGFRDTFSQNCIRSEFLGINILSDSTARNKTKMELHRKGKVNLIPIGQLCSASSSVIILNR